MLLDVNAMLIFTWEIENICRIQDKWLIIEKRPLIFQYDIPRDLSLTDDFRHLRRSEIFEIVISAVIRSSALVNPVLSRVQVSHKIAFQADLEDVEIVTQ